MGGGTSACQRMINSIPPITGGQEHTHTHTARREQDYRLQGGGQVTSNKTGFFKWVDKGQCNKEDTNRGRWGERKGGQTNNGGNEHEEIDL